ncbi:MAG: hypothetical protein ACXVEF_00660, partial [Polyangiales bacterium]
MANNSKSRVAASPVKAIEALVVDVDGASLRVRPAKGRGRKTLVPPMIARNAVMAYAPCEGDRVVIVEGETCAYVIGVLLAANAPLSVKGDDVELKARGRVIVQAGEGVEVVTPSAKVNVGVADVVAQALRGTFGKHEIRAQRLVEKAVDVYREAEAQVETKAGRMRTLVTEAYRLLAGRTDIASKEDT